MKDSDLTEKQTLILEPEQKPDNRITLRLIDGTCLIGVPLTSSPPVAQLRDVTCGRDNVSEDVYIGKHVRVPWTSIVYLVDKP